MSHIIDLERFEEVVGADRKLTLRASEFFREINRQVNLNTVLTGIGSPEGVVVAEPTQQYMDTTGTTGNILYIKQSGIGDTGWILV